MTRKGHLFALGLAVIITMATGWGVYHEWDDYSALDESANRSADAVQRIQDLLSRLKDAETGQRGYLLTGDARYLEPYNTARPRIQALLSQVEARGEFSGDGASLQQLVSEKLAELQRTIDLRRTGHVEAALEIVRTNQGKATMDEIRRLANRASQSEVAKVRAQTALAATHAVRIRLLIVLGSTIATLLLLFSTVRIHRLLRSQELLLADLDRSRRDVELEKEVFETTLRSIGDAVVATDNQGRIRFMNAVAEDLTGWPRHEAAGIPLSHVFPILNETTREPVEDPVSKVLREGVVVGLANHTLLKRRDGREIPIDDSGAPILDRGRRMTGVVLVFRDVTGARLAQQKMAESERRHRMMFEANPQPMWVYETRSLRFLDVNDATTRHYGYSREEFLTLTLRDIRPEEDIPALLEDTEVPSTAFHTDGPWRHKRKDGSIRHVEITCHPIDYQGRDARFVMANDITERRQAEEAVRRSEELYRAIVETASDAILRIDERSRILFASPHAQTIFGWPPEELVGRDLTTLIPERLRQQHLDGMARYLTTGARSLQWAAVELPGLHRDGFEIPLELSLGETRLNGRRFFTAVIRDISDRQQAQERIRAGAELLRAVIETAPLAIWGLDRRGTVTLWNNAASRLFGWEAEEILHKPLPVVPPDRPEALARMLLEDPSEPVLSGHETMLCRRDGSAVPVSLWTAPLTGRDAKVEGALAIVADLTQRKHDEKILAETEAGFRLLFEDNPQPMWVFDAKTFQFIEVNRAAIEHYGYTRDEFLDLRLTDIRVAEELARFLEDMARMQPGVRRPGVSRHRVKNGSLIDVEVVFLRIEFRGVLAIIAVLYDVTEKKRLEEQLRQAQKLEAVGRLAGGVAHDFNNLLTVITGYGEMLQRGDASNPRPVEEILKAAERASGLTRQLLAFSRRQVLQPQILNLSASVLKITTMLGRLLGEDIAVVTNLEPDPWDVSADPGQIDQIIMNLAVNARDAMEMGGTITIRTQNTRLDDAYASSHVGVEPGDYVSLSISDSGVGMTEETRARIFEPFFTTKEAGRGTGLGLSTVYGIVKQSGGNIWVYSELGKGTTFTIYLPRSSGAALPQAPAPRPPHKSTGDETILIVEDDPKVRMLVAAMLSHSGYRTLIVGNADEALRICSDPEVKLDLIISDLVMPGTDGREVGRRAQELRPDIRVLYMSGYTEHAVLRHNTFESGALFIQKPFSHAALASKVRDILDGKTPA